MINKINTFLSRLVKKKIAKVQTSIIRNKKKGGPPIDSTDFKKIIGKKTLYQPRLLFWVWRMQKARNGTPWRSLGVENMTCNVSVEAEEEEFLLKVNQLYEELQNENNLSMRNKASCPHKVSQDNKRVRLQKKTPIPSLPSKLPPANRLQWDTVRAWC